MAANDSNPDTTEETRMPTQLLSALHGAAIAVIVRVLGAVALSATGAILLVEPASSADLVLSCVWQSHGAGHEKRSFNITFDQQMQRAALGGNQSLPATITDNRISFALNLSGSIYQYAIDRPSGYGTVTIKDDVVYSGTCTARRGN
jgi:hypothetical protein